MIALEIGDEMLDERACFIAMSAGDVRRDEASRFAAERVVHGGAPADVVEGGAGFHLCEACGVDEIL